MAHDLEMYKLDLIAMHDAMENAQITGRPYLGRRIRRAAFNYHMVVRISNTKSKILDGIAAGSLSMEEIEGLIAECKALEVELNEPAPI